VRSRASVAGETPVADIGMCVAAPTTNEAQATIGPCIGSMGEPSTGVNDMTAQLFRTVSTCVAALFVSTMLVTAATSMPLI
jgi:hypothetical protein